MTEHSHYHKNVSHLKTLDIYGVCELFEVDDPSGCIQHAVKKLLMAGNRGSKSKRQDLQEALDTIQRRLEMMDPGKDEHGAYKNPAGMSGRGKCIMCSNYHDSNVKPCPRSDGHIQWVG